MSLAARKDVMVFVRGIKRAALFAFASVLLSACSSASVDQGMTGDEAINSKKKDTEKESPPVLSPGTPPSAPAADALVYAHTADTLYTFDAIAKKLVQVGKLGCLTPGERLLDIAVDGKGAVFGTSDQAFVAINPKDATCTRVVAEEDLPNSLSFVPAGALDETKDALVGYAFDDVGRAVRYVRIDTTTGRVTDIGMLNPPNAAKQYVSSGDIFSVRRDSNKTYLTVRDDEGTEGTAEADMLAEIDPKTGAIKRIIGSTQQPRIYGLAYWAGKAYGFSEDGNVIEIDVTTGVSTLVTTLKTDTGPVPWYGAGVTTEAPTTPQPR
jgi:hypothetical protein